MQRIKVKMKRFPYLRYFFLGSAFWIFISVPTFEGMEHMFAKCSDNFEDCWAGLWPCPQYLIQDASGCFLTKMLDSLCIPLHVHTCPPCQTLSPARGSRASLGEAHDAQTIRSSASKQIGFQFSLWFYLLCDLGKLLNFSEPCCPLSI